jgi:hypothetical protein
MVDTAHGRTPSGPSHRLSAVFCFVCVLWLGWKWAVYLVFGPQCWEGSSRNAIMACALSAFVWPYPGTLRLLGDMRDASLTRAVFTLP